MKPSEKMKKALVTLVIDNPFFGSLALRLKIKEDCNCNTAWVNGKEIGYNPEWVENLTLEKTKGLIAHEIMHIVMLHHTRRSGRNSAQWNEACDYAINDILIESKFKLPDDGLKGMGTDKTAEDIYSKLNREKEPGQEDNGKSGNNESGQDGNGKGEPGEKQGNATDPGNCGEVRDCTGKNNAAASPAELKEIENDMKTMVAQAAQQAKSCGKMSAGIKRLIDEMIEPQLPWQELLKQFITKTAKNDYSWMPPNRRFIHLGLYLPSCNSEELGDIVIAIDTSGSINQRELSEFSSEVNSILEEYDTTLTVIYCDTKINNVEVFTKNDLPIAFNATGYGGTDFRPPFHWVEEQGISPTCLLYFTDLECWKFPEEPNYPVLWIKTGTTNRKPPFGEIIEIQ